MNLRAYYLESRMIAFTENLIDGNVLQQHYVGLDYDSDSDVLLKYILLDTVRDVIPRNWTESDFHFDTIKVGEGNEEIEIHRG